MRKRNHRMKSRAANCLYLENILANSKPPPANEAAGLMIELRVAYERIKCGSGTTADIHTLGLMLNTGEVRGEAIAPELVKAFCEAGAALVECEDRLERHGRYGFTGPGILAMNAAMDFYEQILTLSSVKQLDDAKNEALRRLKAAVRAAA